MEQLHIVVKNLRNKTDSDGVKFQFVLDSWNHIGKTILDIMNQSIKEGILSDCWKRSIVMVKIAGATRTREVQTDQHAGNISKDH